MNFNEALAAYLTSKQSTPVFCDYLPSEPSECVFFTVFAAVPKTYEVVRHVQIQVHRKKLIQAYEDAFALSLLMDSGTNEELIELSPEWSVIIRPTAKPRSLGFDASGQAKYYFEVAVCGADKE